MTEINEIYSNHIIIYLILYKIDNNKNIYKLGTSTSSNIMPKYNKAAILLYQRIVQNNFNKCSMFNYFKNKYINRFDIAQSCYEGNFNDMINTINQLIEGIYKNGYIMNDNFAKKSSEKPPITNNIPLISPKRQYVISNKNNEIITPTIPVIIPKILQRETEPITKPTIKSIERNSKETIDNIKKYIDCLSPQRIKENYIIIGNCLQNIDDELYDTWYNLNINSYNTCMTSPSLLWYKMTPNTYNIADLKYWAVIDNAEKVFNIIENDIIRAINKISDHITPYNMAMIAYKHFKHFHIYTNNEWYYYDTITNKWDIDKNKMNITQSLISNISIIFERYTNYDNIIKMYNDKLFVDEVLSISANIFFNKNNYLPEYITNNLISHKSLP
jgi:hypothetical protein